MPIARLIWPWLAFAAVLALAAPARAQATVRVEVRTPEGEPANGRVTLEPKADDKEKTYGCSTTKGSCRIADVPGGRYVVRLDLDEGEAPPPRTAMIPPSGEVSLVVSTRDDDAED